MSCKFNINHCPTCPKYNTCLVSNFYNNINKIADSIIILSKTQSKIIDDINGLKSNDITNSDDNLGLSLSLDDVNKKVDILTQYMEDRESTHDEISDDISLIKSSLLLLDIKLNTILKTNEYLMDIKG
jgi:hypothetical protein